MTLKENVTSLDLSKRLKEEGIEIDSYWVHILDVEKGVGFTENRELEKEMSKLAELDNPRFIEAPTATEILNLFPLELDLKEKHLYGGFTCYHCDKDPYGHDEDEVSMRTSWKISSLSDERYQAIYEANGYEGDRRVWSQHANDKKLCDALARLLLELIEENIIDVEQLNN